MSPKEIADLTARVDALDRVTARRVARLVLECRANLKDALRAVEMVDAERAAHMARRPAESRKLLHMFFATQ